MLRPTAVINVVALSEGFLEHAPKIRKYAEHHSLRRVKPGLPALTCSVQSSMLTGQPVSGHGIVGNGWFDRDLNEVHFWKQSNRLVGGEKVWETAKKLDPAFTCANLFWWFNMYSSVDYAVTPRPIYKADGRKIPDIWTNPPELRGLLQEELGQFPLFNFWGPGASIRSSEWIAQAAMRVYERHAPTLTLVYLPHLDYPLQKLGPGHADIPDQVRRVDRVVGGLIDFFEERGVRVVLLSEYAIEPVDTPIEINRILRKEGGIEVRDEEGGEVLDPGLSRCFAVADHQVAQVYVRDSADIPRYAELCRSIPGVDLVLDRNQQREREINHDRSGDLFLMAKSGYWFAYQYWLDDQRAPDFARTVDIHRKPGYDPLELFLDPRIQFPGFRIARKLLQKKLGFRTLLDLIPLDNSLVRGSHGIFAREETQTMPILIAPEDRGFDPVPCTEVRKIILDSVFGPDAGVGAS